MLEKKRSIIEIVHSAIKSRSFVRSKASGQFKSGLWILDKETEN